MNILLQKVINSKNINIKSNDKKKIFLFKNKTKMFSYQNVNSPNAN